MAAKIRSTQGTSVKRTGRGVPVLIRYASATRILTKILFGAITIRFHIFIISIHFPDTVISVPWLIKKKPAQRVLATGTCRQKKRRLWKQSVTQEFDDYGTKLSAREPKGWWETAFNADYYWYLWIKDGNHWVAENYLFASSGVYVITMKVPALRHIDEHEN